MSNSQTAATPTPDQRQQRIEDLKVMVLRREVEPGVPDSRDDDVAFLLAELDRRDQEHQKQIANLHEEIDLDGNLTRALNHSTDIIERMKERHAEEISKAKALVEFMQRFASEENGLIQRKFIGEMTLENMQQMNDLVDELDNAVYDAESRAPSPPPQEAA